MNDTASIMAHAGVNPLDMWDLMINEISGGMFYFILFSYVLLAFACAKFRIPNQAFIILSIIWAMILAPYSVPMLIIACLIIVFLIAWAYQKYTGRT